MPAAAEIFEEALAATDDAYLIAENRLRERGAEALQVLRQHAESEDPVARLLVAVLIPWIEGETPENDEALSYLDDLPKRIARTPAGTPRTGGIPFYLKLHFEDRIVPVIALRLLKMRNLPRWYALGAILYLGEQRKPEATEALLLFAIETTNAELRRFALEAIRAISDPDLLPKIETSLVWLARRFESLSVEIVESGIADGLRRAIRALCAAFGIELDAEREAALEAMDPPELEALQERLLRERSWSPLR